MIFPLENDILHNILQAGQQSSWLIPPCSITPCQPLKLMSKVMTDLHPRRLRHSRGLIRVAKVVITREKELDELWRIRGNRGLNRRRPGDPLPADRESLLIQANLRLERLLEKANQDKELLCNMKTHYWARLHVCKAKMKILQRKLSEARKRKKRTNPLRILAEASLTHHDTHQP